MTEFKETLKFSPHNNNNILHQQQQQQRPTITIPPKPSAANSESFFSSSPGSMSFTANFFSNNLTDNSGDFRSFSDLLSGGGPLSLLGESGDGGRRENGGGGGGGGFKQNRPGNLILPVNVPPTFAVSPGFSPSAFLNSPTLFSPSLQSSFNMSCQQALAQATLISQPNLGLQSEFHPPNPSMTFQSTPFSTPQQLEPTKSVSQPETRRPPQSFPAAVDKPADDGYNWRKYGQKQVKGSEYPRSYYRCTHPNCPVKKKVERSFDGHITEIIYKGQHNHEPPQSGRRLSRDSNADLQHGQNGHFPWSSGRGHDNSAQATSMQLHGPSDSEESGENYQQFGDDEDEDDEDEPNAKRSRNAGAGQSDVPYTHKTMTEPKIVVQTRSEVDLLDDGYRWRKYGQKVVKGNPNPRSYYKCTTVGCKVRKHVERASTDPRAVITTYEGKHNHDVPAARGTNVNNAPSNIEAQQSRLHSSVGHINFGNKDQLPISLRLKEEQIAV